MKPELSRILQGVARYWDVPVSWLGADKHWFERVVITTAILDTEVRSLVLKHASSFRPGNFLNVAKCKEFPVAALIGELPLTNEVTFIDVWNEESLEAATRIVVVNPLLQKYGQYLMRFTKSFLQLNQIGESRCVDGWCFDRLRQPRYFLHAKIPEIEILDGASFERILKSLPSEKQSFFRADGFNVRPPSSIRSRPTLDQKLENLLRRKLAESGIKDERAVTETLTAIHDAILFDLESLMDAGMASDPTQFNICGQAYYSNSAVSDARFYQCSVPSDGILGAGDIETLVHRCLKNAFDPTCTHWAESATILISCAVWHPLNEMQTLKVRGNLAFSSLKRRTKPVDENLHEPVGATFWRIIPPRLAEQFFLLQEAGFPTMDKIKMFLATIRPWFTASRLRQSLLCVCSTVWEFPPVLPLIGLFPLSEKSPAIRSYCRIDWRQVELCGRWLSMFDPTMSTLSKAIPAGFMPCGSPNVPKQTELQQFGATIQKLLNEELPTNHSEAVKTLNAISCGLQLFGTVLLGGLRNWPMMIPSDGEGGWYGYQKAPFAVKPASLLSAWLLLYQVRLEELTSQCVASGIEVDWIGIRSISFCLFDLEKESRLIPSGFDAQEIATALALCPQTWKWKGFYPGGMRHFSMSELYAAGFATNDIEAFHHRSLSSLHPFRIHRLEPVIASNHRLTMEMHLRSLVNL